MKGQGFGVLWARLVLLASVRSMLGRQPCTLQNGWLEMPTEVGSPSILG